MKWSAGTVKRVVLSAVAVGLVVGLILGLPQLLGSVSASFRTPSGANAEGTPSATPTPTSSPTAGASAHPRHHRPKNAGQQLAPGIVVSPAEARRLRKALKALNHGNADALTTFRVATFNDLGFAHTAPGGDRKGWASGITRMHWAYGLIQGSGVSVVGFQEFEGPQLHTFEHLAGASWDVFPGASAGVKPMQNSIAWRKDTWTLEKSGFIGVPYFFGRTWPMPYVLLKHQQSGREVWFLNVHNPASKFGPAGRWRVRAVRAEATLIDRLHATGHPVVFTGDFNDSSAAFCAVTAATSMKAAAGGSNEGRCRPPAGRTVDWIFGTHDVVFTNYVRQVNGVKGRVTDHPYVYAQAVF